MADTTDLRALAQFATPGPWTVDPPNNVTSKWAVRTMGANPWFLAETCLAIPGKPERANAHYIAAAHPQAILALLDRQERLVAALRVAEAALADIGDSDHEPWDDLIWCEQRAARALPQVRAELNGVPEEPQ